MGNRPALVGRFFYVKGASAFPADYAEGGVNKDFPKEKKSMVDGKVFSMADERDY